MSWNCGHGGNEQEPKRVAFLVPETVSVLHARRVAPSTPLFHHTRRLRPRAVATPPQPIPTPPGPEVSASSGQPWQQ
eukprot:11048616-Alexandrium_andersonii.AAC.1